MAHPFDFRYRHSRLKRESLRNGKGCGDRFVAGHLIVDFITHAQHRLREPFQLHQLLKCLGLGNESSLAGDPEDQSFILQVAQSLPYRNAADAK